MEHKQDAQLDQGHGFASALITWQAVHGRHDLPWQGTHDPYRIWISEIMLQQTQVSAAISYFTRFMERFPTVAALAEAHTDEVLALWSGLGYYARARNLHRAARAVISVHQGRFPVTRDVLETLPGIGRSTAAAIAAFASGAREAILDGNVKRVLSRHFAIPGFPGAKTVEMRLWRLAESLLPDHALPAYTQALMDLGATVCTRARPRCAACPLAASCLALRSDRVNAFPEPRPRRARPLRQQTLWLLVDRASCLLERRPPAGIWGGLWSLPEQLPSWVQGMQSHGMQAQGMQAQGRQAQGMPAPGESLQVRHEFTHFSLDITVETRWIDRDGAPPHRVTDETAAVRAVADAGSEQRWLHYDEALQLGLPAPIRRILEGQCAAGLFSGHVAHSGRTEAAPGARADLPAQAPAACGPAEGAGPRPAES